MKISAIIVAAGTGKRLGFDIPKAFVQLNGASLLRRATAAIVGITGLTEIVIAVPAGMEKPARDEVATAVLRVPVKIVPGGDERQDSVRASLALTSAEAELIVIHDAARPFATTSLFEACIAVAMRSGAAIAATPVADTLKRLEGRTISTTLPRAGLWQAQTPQAFHRGLLSAAHAEAVRRQVIATDDADLVERTGTKVEVVEGSVLNLKITTPDDLRIAEAVARLVFPH